MENLTLIALAENLKPALSGMIVRRVIQHQPNGFIFQTRFPKLPAIKLLAHAQNPALYASEVRPPIETPGSDFLMVLRKHLTSAELTEFRKPLSERVFEFVFKTAVPSKELETMTLVVELIPNAPNIILLDAERRILASFSPVTPQHGIGEFDVYALPSVGGKIPLERTLTEDVPELNELDPQKDSPGSLIARVSGIGPVFAGEILHRQRKSGLKTTEEIRNLLRQARAPSQAAWLYTAQPLGHILERNDLRHFEKAVVSPVELHSLERSYSSRVFANILEAARFYFDELESRTLLEQNKLPALRDLRTVAKRLLDREKKLIREKARHEEATTLHKTAQMLATSGLKMDQHYDSAEVTDYFGDSPKSVRIALDPAITLRENIDKMFKLHHKAGRGAEVVDRQLAEIRSRSAAIAEQLRRLQAIRDWDTWLAIVDRIDKERRGDAPGGGPAEARLKRFRSLTIDGREFLIGRNGRENDELTFHAAGPEDFWFHVADYSGSHVVVRNPGREKEPPEDVLIKAAQLAAYFSQARNASKVEVHYTRRKHVTKPRRAKPGLVRLIEFKSITVEPKNWLDG